jgi:hypothetical protein
LRLKKNPEPLHIVDVKDKEVQKEKPNTFNMIEEEARAAPDVVSDKFLFN